MLSGESSFARLNIDDSRANVAIWLLAILIAGFFALLLRDSSYYNGEWLPRGNDSLYHAKRILDAISGGGFYQFDNDIHAPDGSWISWPWGYDYLLAKATQFALWLSPGLDPVKFFSYAPVVWIAVNAALFLAAATALGLTTELRLLAMLCFALSPLTQMLHCIGNIDHHYVEQTFALLTTWFGLRWFQKPDSARWAILLGIALGLAPAFHNGLFILQLLPLATLFVCWWRGTAPPWRSIRDFALALLVATQLILIPSEPYRNGMFEYGLLSWFHFYIAICTAAAALFMGWRGFSPRNLAVFAVLCVLLAVPLATQLGSGAGFLSGEFSIMADIGEVHSPYRMFTQTYGPTGTASFYSWLLVLAPFLLLLYLWQILRDERRERIFFAVTVVFGLAMLLSQYRLYLYGYFSLVAGSLLVVQELRNQFQWQRAAVFALALIGVFLAFQPALRQRLFSVYAPGGSADYADTLPTYHLLQRLCAKEPGVVLAGTDDGAPIVYHTDCKVIGLNFILRKEDKAHIDEVFRLMRLPVEEIRKQRPDIRYLLVRGQEFSMFQNRAAQWDPRSPIARELFMSDTFPPGVTLLQTIADNTDESSRARIYTRLFRLEPNGASNSPHTTDRGL